MQPGGRTSYGVDWDGAQAVVVALTGRRASPELLWSGPAEADDPEWQAVCAAIRRRTEGGRGIAAAAMPAAESLTRRLTAPFASLRKARSVWPSLLDIQLPFSLEQCAWQFIDPRPAAGQVSTLAVAAQATSLQKRLDQLRALGVDPMVLDHEGLALWARSLAEAPPAAGEIRIVAWLGRQACVLVTGRGADYGNAHPIRLGTEPGPGAQDALGAALAQRGRRLLQPLLSGPDAGARVRWFWAGPGAARAETVARLAQALNLECPVDFAVHAQPELFLARALAWRAEEPGPLACNLLHDAWAHPLMRRAALRRGRGLAWAAFLVGLLLWGLSMAWFELVGARERQAQAAVAALAREIIGGPAPRGQEVFVALRVREDQTRAAAPFMAALQPSRLEEISAVLRKAALYGITLDTLAVRDDGLEVSGAAEDWGTCEALSREIESRGFSAALDRRDAGADEKVHFQIKGRRP